MNPLTLNLLAGMAHELRTPLGAIGGYSELLELGVHGPVTGAQVDGLRRIRHNQQLMVSLLNAFMSYAEAATGDINLDPEPLPLRRMLADAIRDIGARAQERRVAVVTPPALTGDEENDTVQADRFLLESLLRELVVDAVESAAGDDVVHIAVARAAGRLVVEFCTAGNPFESGTVDAVFEPFSREVKSNRPSASRHALSLPHARLLARSLHGDVIAVPDSLNRMVTLDLPAA